MKLVFATHNQNKFEEVKKLMPEYVELVSLDDIGCHEEIPETGKTLEENAKIKANHVTSKYGLPCFSDDTGLFIDALNGEPGVFSARYAGEDKNTQANIEKVLQELKGVTNRDAYFKTMLVLNIETKSFIFEGRIDGTITLAPKGNKGFGYDPIFMPNNRKMTFAELPLTVKNHIGHRGIALGKLVQFLKSYPND